MKIRIDCDNKKEMDEIIELLNSRYNVSNIHILKKEDFSFLDNNYFIELTTNDKIAESNTYTELFEFEIGFYYIYKNNLVQIIKIDASDKSTPYKCNIFSDTGRIVDSKWVNYSELTPVRAISKVNIEGSLNATTISKIKKDWTSFKKNLNTVRQYKKNRYQINRGDNMPDNLNHDNIKGFATFKYKSIPNQKDLSKILSFYSLISSRETYKSITVFDWEGDTDTIIFDSKGLLNHKNNTASIEQVLGFILAHIANHKEAFVIVREPNSDNSSSKIYGFQILDANITPISANTLRAINENSKNITGLTPEQNIEFIEI